MAVIEETVEFLARLVEREALVTDPVLPSVVSNWTGPSEPVLGFLV